MAINEHNVESALERALIARQVSASLSDHHMICRASAALGSAFRLAGCYDLSREKMKEAKLAAGRCLSCIAEVERRWAVLNLYENRYEESLQQLNLAADTFESLSKRADLAKVLVTRGIVWWKLGQPEKALADEHAAIDNFSDDMPSFYYISAMLNATAFSLENDHAEMTLQAIQHLREVLKGVAGCSRVRVLVRWVRGLLLKKMGRLKSAAELLESAESGMIRLSMKPELRALYADLAGTKKREDAIVRVAKKALKIEASEEVCLAIQRVVRDPTPTNVVAWRSALDSPFPFAA